MNEKAVQFENRRNTEKIERQMLRRKQILLGNYAGIYNTYTKSTTVTTDMTNFNVNGSAGGAADFNDKLKNISSIPVEVNENIVLLIVVHYQ